MMNAWIEIRIFGDGTHLATLRKQEDVPLGVYSSQPIASLINLTATIKANVRLHVQKVSLEDNAPSLLVSGERLQLSELLPTLGVQNFYTFLKETEKLGWSAEKFIDGIGQYFHLDHNNQPMSPPAVASENALTLFLFFFMAATPACVLLVMNKGLLVSPYYVFVLFLGVTAVVHTLTFAVMQYIRTRGQHESRVAI